MCADETRIILSIVCPVLNEEEIIRTAALAIRAVLNPTSISYEILFVDDGSIDNTWEIISELSARHPEIRGVRLSRNFGHDAALMAGFAVAQGEFALTIDSDGEHPFAVIPDLLSLQRESGADIVNAVKAHSDRVGSLRAIGAWLFGKVASRLLGAHLEYATEFKLLSRRAYTALLRCNDHHVFYRALVPWIGFKQVDYQYQPEAGMRDYSHWTLRSLVRFAFSGSILFTDAPLRGMFYLGIALHLLSLFLAAKVLIAYFTGSAIPTGYSTLLLAILINLSVMLIGFGVLGAYVRTTLQQTLGRPRAIIAEVRGTALPDSPFV